MKLYEKLQMLRKDKKLSQEELADVIGITRQAVAKWELGITYPDIDNLILLSELYKVSIDRLVKEEGECNKELIELKHSEESHIISFLLRAKRATYAGNGQQSQASRPASHDFDYSEGELHYIDTYLGGEKFAGEEAVWQNETPIWTMNYVGRVLQDTFRGEFLKEALLHVPEDIPYRGPLHYQKGDYNYHCTITGEFSWHQGYEEIFCKGEKVYECYFHGGSLR